MAGRPHKGDRILVASRPMKPVADEIRARAAARGISMSEYVAAVLSAHTGHPEYANLPEPIDEEALPLTG